MAHADYIVGLYGARRFLADVDAGREFWRDDAGIVGATLDWAATDGFMECVGAKARGQWTDVSSFRQRHLIAALRRV